jgi:hypothetical protein
LPKNSSDAPSIQRKSSITIRTGDGRQRASILQKFAGVQANEHIVEPRQGAIGNRETEQVKQQAKITG